MDWIGLLGLACFIGFALRRLRVRRQRLREAALAREAAFVASLRGDFGKAIDGDHAAASSVPRHDPARRGRAVDERAVVAALPIRGNPPAYLSSRQLSVYRLLRDAAPEVDVFVRAYLHWLVGKGAGEKALQLDFVCCDHRSQPRMVIDLIRDADEPAVCEFKRERLAAAGIVYLRWDVAVLPGRDEIARLLSGLGRSA